MTVVDFFNPNNIDHIKAFEYFRKESKWPEDFLIEEHDINFYPSKWEYKIVEKISKVYIKNFKNRSSKLANFLCYLIDNHNGDMISEDFLLNTVSNFINSKYNRME